MKLLLAIGLFTACSSMRLDGAGVRNHHLAGAWQSPRGDHFLIGCSGAFNHDLNDELTTTHESGAHISEVTETGFTVSHWPLAESTYDVAAWPHKDSRGRTVMQAEGMEWVESRAIDCD
jgi:hypothetical protein